MKTLELRSTLGLLVASLAGNLAFAGGGCASHQPGKTRPVRNGQPIAALQRLLQSSAVASASSVSTALAKSAASVRQPTQPLGINAVSDKTATADSSAPKLAEVPVLAPATNTGFPADLPPSELSEPTDPDDTPKAGSLANLIGDFLAPDRR